MVDPEVEALIEQVPSKYALVVAVARRARQLVASGDAEARDRAVSRALAEAAALVRQERALTAPEGDGASGTGWSESA